jgi:Xaa-Pro aminopeptidase
MAKSQSRPLPQADQSAIAIPRAEFAQRVERIRAAMHEQGLHALMVYGDEYRKENLRYVSNAWPLFERGACFIARTGEPIVCSMAEGERTIREQSPWTDVRNLKELAAVTVPEEIDYPNSTFATLGAVVTETLAGGRRLGVVGLADMPMPLHVRLAASVPGLELVDAAEILTKLRLIKSENEIACLRESGRIACLAYRHLLRHAVPGNTELFAAGAAEGAARQAGAESIVFHVMGSGRRADGVIPRPTTKVIRDGEMVMASLAVQFQGYVATAEFPFVAGKATLAQRDFLTTLFEAADAQYRFITDGADSGAMVRAVSEIFAKRGWSKYDLYPPMHGCGLAEAESPYPNTRSTYQLRRGMCVNSDISLFGHPAGSNRIEEGFAIREGEPESLTPLIRRLCAERRVDFDGFGIAPE